MPGINDACTRCVAGPDGIDQSLLVARKIEVISGKVPVPRACFVADEIHFKTGQLVFQPVEGVRDYFVICRKLVLVGGTRGIALDPCRAGSPGNVYESANVITWEGRLHAAEPGPDVSPPKADDVADWPRGQWQDKGQGPDGMPGPNGLAGGSKPDGSWNAKPGKDGSNAPGSVTLVFLELAAGLDDHLIVDWSGQVGGDGGAGQNGGKGGNGMGGIDSTNDHSIWSGTECTRQPGNGGRGGDGGAGGQGGTGGKGGSGGEVRIVSWSYALANSNQIIPRMAGGKGGDGGRGGFGGLPGEGGFWGVSKTACGNAVEGIKGSPGGTGAKGDPGPGGQIGKLAIDLLVFGQSCADRFPLPPVLSPASLQPVKEICADKHGATSAGGFLAGQRLAQIKAVNVRKGGALTAISAKIKPLTSSDTKLDLDFDIPSNPAPGPYDLELVPNFGAPTTFPGAIDVKVFQVTAVSPASAARNTVPSVTITGQCFDNTAAIQLVAVSGGGVSAINMIVINPQTIQCAFDVAPLAALGPRHVTVKTGSLQDTLINGFTVA